MSLTGWLSKPRSRMALRIYAIGLVQFLIVALVLVVEFRAREAERHAAFVARTEAREAPPWRTHGLFVARGLARVIDEPPALAEEVARITEAFAWTVDVRGPDGDLLAHGEGPGPTFGKRSEVEIPMKDGRNARFAWIPHFHSGASPPNPHPDRGSASVGAPPPPPREEGGGPLPGGGPPPPGAEPSRVPAPPVGLTAAVVLVVVGVSSWLTARSFARPLASLTEATRAFGRGELDARANMERGDEIGEVARAFDDMADRITALLLAERELLANVSHELRTPLARIRVALDLASEADPKVAVESFADIAQDLAELERIVDDVLASARLALNAAASVAGPASSGNGPRSGGAMGLSVRPERVDPHALLDKSVGRFRSKHPQRDLVVSVAADLPAVDADPVLLRRVIDNLLDNAQKYTPKDARIHLQASTDARTVLIEVRDEGQGIGKEDLARLFEPFFRADRSRTRSTGGLGLGLTLARRVVEAHGGKLSITSELGKGTCASVRLVKSVG